MIWRSIQILSLREIAGGESNHKGLKKYTNEHKSWIK